MRFSDATLMAFADGELSPEDAARIEAALEADPDLAARVQRFRAVRRALRTVYDGVAAEPIPEHLRALLGDVASSESATPAPPPKQGVRRAFSAASIAAIAVALIIGVMGGRLSAPAAPLFVEDASGLHGAGALAQALNDNLSDTPENADAKVRIGFTFRDGQGGACRTFRHGVTSGVACHSANRWDIHMLSSDTDIGAAGASPAIIALVDTMIDGDPLSASEERLARDLHWANEPAPQQSAQQNGANP